MNNKTKHDLEQMFSEKKESDISKNRSDLYLNKQSRNAFMSFTA